MCILVYVCVCNVCVVPRVMASDQYIRPPMIMCVFCVTGLDVYVNVNFQNFQIFHHPVALLPKQKLLCILNISVITNNYRNSGCRS